MKKLIVTLLTIEILPTYAQRYTGWGRGLDWGGGNSNGIVTLIFLLSIPVITLIAWLYFSIVEKIKSLNKKEVPQIVNNSISKTKITPKEEKATPKEKIKPEDFILINEYPLVSFVRNNGGKLQIGQCTDASTGHTYKTCMVSNNENRIYIKFHPNLGELTSEEISKRKNDLFVGQMKSSKFYLYANNTQFRTKASVKSNVRNIKLPYFNIEDRELTNDQKIVTLIFLSVFTDRTVEKEIEYKRFLKIGNNCVAHYPFKEKMLYGGTLSPKLKEEFIETMSSITDKSIIDKFIFYSCNSCHFFERKDNVNEFTCILINWGYTQEEIYHLVKYSKLMQDICSKEIIDYMDIDDFKSYIAEKLHNKGFDYNEIAAIEYLDSVYDGSEDFEIHLLTNAQRFALLGWFIQMSKYKVISNRMKKINELRQYLVHKLKIKEEDYRRILQDNSSSRYDYADIIKTIKLDEPLNIFFSAWRDLIHLEKGCGIIYNRYVQMFKLLGYSKDDIEQSLNDIAIYKY